MNMLKRFLPTLLALTVLGILGIQQTAAAGLTLTPLTFEETLKPGETFAGIVKITNSDPQPVSLNTLVSDFYLTEQGQMTFVDEGDPGRSSYSLRDWMKIEMEQFDLAPNESREVQFTITVPENAEPGGHYGVVFFETAGTKTVEGSGVEIGGRIGALVLITVPGQLTQTGEASDFQSGTVDANKAFTAKNSFEKGPVTLQFLFKNTGNSHYRPTGQIQITSGSGKQVTVLNIQDNRAFPGSPRAYQSDWMPTALFGKFTATLVVNDGEGKALPPMTTSFTIFPTKMVLTWGLGLLILILILIPVTKKYNQWIVEKSRKR